MRTFLIFVCLLHAACSGDGDQPGPSASTCTAGLAALETACIPQLDDCNGDEVPRPGGGCKRVGVRECPGGIAGPPDWTCKPIGPPAACSAGWTKVPGGWCEPELPGKACPDGTMAVLGKRDCQPIGDCGAGSWGKIKVTQSTVFVDGAYRGSSPDGSQSRPYTTITAALSAGGHIAVAAGTYDEDLTLSTAGTVLEGRCARLVTIRGKGTRARVVRLPGSSTVLRGVTVRGVATGALLQAGILTTGTKVTIEDVVVRDSPYGGIDVRAGSLTVRESLIRDNGWIGLDIQHDTTYGLTPPRVTLERATIRGTAAPGGGAYGAGLNVDGGADVQLRDSLVTGTTGVAAIVNGSKLLVERAKISYTREDKHASTATGFGVFVQPGYYTKAPSSVQIRDSLIEDNTNTGIAVVGDSTLDVVRTVVAGTRPSALLERDGSGITANITPQMKKPGRLTIKECLVVGNHTLGVGLQGYVAAIERTVVRDTRPVSYQSHEMGYGIQAGPGKDVPGSQSTVTVRDSLVAGSVTYGVRIDGSKATLERVVVRDTRLGYTGPGGGLAGIGIGTGPSSPRPGLVLRDSLVSNSRMLGLGLQGVDATVERSVVRGTSGDASGRYGLGVSINAAAARRDPARVTVTDCVVADNRFAGIDVANSRADIRGTVVRDTRVEPSSGRYGHGINVGQVTGLTLPALLNLTDSRVSESHAHGISVQAGATATIRRSAVLATSKDARGYGDGIVAAAGSARLVVVDTLVSHSARAGLAFIGAGGTVSRSVVRKGQIAVGLDKGAAPTLGEDNVFVDNEHDGIVRGKGIKASRPPDVVPPPAPPAP